jgi:hypothetical protein
MVLTFRENLRPGSAIVARSLLLVTHFMQSKASCKLLIVVVNTSRTRKQEEDQSLLVRSRIWIRTLVSCGAPKAVSQQLYQRITE